MNCGIVPLADSPLWLNPGLTLQRFTRRSITGERERTLRWTTNLNWPIPIKPSAPTSGKGFSARYRGWFPLVCDTHWLDFGCGNGGLVRHVRQHTACDIVGFEEGHIVARAKEKGAPMVSREELEQSEGRFNVITAVEVLEHTVDPVAEVRRICRLLKPGGLFFLTTGNAKPFRGRLARWPYVLPEVHISFFEPETLAWVMKKVGLEPEFRGWLPGFEKIIRFKVLKSLGIRRHSLWERLLPITISPRLIDAYFGISRHPIGWQRSSP